VVLSISSYAVAISSDYQWGTTKGFRDIATIGMGQIIPYVSGAYITSTHELSTIIFQEAVVNHKDSTISPEPFKESIVGFQQSLVTNNSTRFCSHGLTDIAIPKYTDRPMAGEIWGGTATHISPLGSKLYNINNFDCYDKVYDNRLVAWYFDNRK
jgi:hypothetical protein